jgi:hypothetical protein
MGFALQIRPAPLAPPRSLLLYCRPFGDFAVQDARVDELVRESGLRIELETLSPSSAARRLRTWVSSNQPSLILLRGGEIVSIAVGCLPRRELQRLIEHSLA